MIDFSSLGHIVFTSSIALLFMPILYATQGYYWTMAGLLIGCILPDIDHQGTKLGKLLPNFLQKALKHRKQTHSLLFALVSAVITYLISNLYVAQGVYIGVLLHIGQDALTPQGINWLFYPIENNKKIKRRK